MWFIDADLINEIFLFGIWWAVIVEGRSRVGYSNNRVESMI